MPFLRCRVLRVFAQKILQWPDFVILGGHSHHQNVPKNPRAGHGTFFFHLNHLLISCDIHRESRDRWDLSAVYSMASQKSENKELKVKMKSEKIFYDGEIGVAFLLSTV